MAEALIQPCLKLSRVPGADVDHRAGGEQAVGLEGILHRRIGRQQAHVPRLPATQAARAQGQDEGSRQGQAALLARTQ
ncbi:hypothetical protein D3C84_950190 [compost metagenome]